MIVQAVYKFNVKSLHYSQKFWGNQMQREHFLIFMNTICICFFFFFLILIDQTFLSDSSWLAVANCVLGSLDLLICTEYMEKCTGIAAWAVLLEPNAELFWALHRNCPSVALALYTEEKHQWVKRKFKNPAGRYHSWNCFWCKFPFPTWCCSLLLYLVLTHLYLAASWITNLINSSTFHSLTSLMFLYHIISPKM